MIQISTDVVALQSELKALFIVGDQVNVATPETPTIEDHVMEDARNGFTQMCFWCIG